MTRDIAPAMPSVAVILPCHDEAATLPGLLAALLPQLAEFPTWQLVAVDDSSSDTTGELLDDAAASVAAAGGRLTVIHGAFGSPGAARTAAASSVTVLGHGAPPDWLLTTDCDVDLPSDFVSGWQHQFVLSDDDGSIGAINGGEEQGHLFVGLPNARRASRAFGLAAMRSEAAVGVTNLNGVNHAVRTAAYLTAGPYEQPTLLGPAGRVNLAGEDWDLGVRLRLAGYEIADCPVAVRDKGRRLLADVHAYLTGEAYEGAFTRVGASAPPVDLDADEVDRIAVATVDRVLVHFFFKAVLACPHLLDRPLGLDHETVAAMRAWIARWPEPTFAASRSGFVHGRLPRFATAFTPTVRSRLGLDVDDILTALESEG